MLRAGVIGCGYWGPNLIRNFDQISETDMVCVADIDETRLSHMKKLYPNIKVTSNYRNLISDPDLDIIAIATPSHTHFQIASEALNSGKHTFVEKPLTVSVKQAEKLVELAEANGHKLMAGHTFIYTSAVQKMKEIISSGELGDIYYINSQRLNLGLIQNDINVIWDLAPHDISIILYLTGQKPLSVSAIGASHINSDIEDVAVLTLQFAENLIAFIQTSWLDPDKIRRMTVVGSKKMMVFDDVQPTEKIRIYDKSIEIPKHYDTYAEFHYSYKYGDILIPKIDGAEPIKTELTHFVDWIQGKVEPLSDGQNGLDVVRVLQAAQQSLEHNYSPVSLDKELMEKSEERIAKMN
jgi:predicted dehydrogenase